MDKNLTSFVAFHQFCRYICPDGNDSTQECLWENPLTMVRDELYGGPAVSKCFQFSCTFKDFIALMYKPILLYHLTGPKLSREGVLFECREPV